VYEKMVRGVAFEKDAVVYNRPAGQESIIVRPRRELEATCWHKC
jgi:hypothetical protein